MAEIQKVAKKDPALAAAGAVEFLGKLSPALGQVDSSSGAIGTAVNHAIETCATIIAEAPVTPPADGLVRSIRVRGPNSRRSWVRSDPYRPVGCGCSSLRTI